MGFTLWRGVVEPKEIGRCKLAVDREYKVVPDNERLQGANNLWDSKHTEITVELRESYVYSH